MSLLTPTRPAYRRPLTKGLAAILTLSACLAGGNALSQDAPPAARNVDTYFSAGQVQDPWSFGVMDEKGAERATGPEVVSPGGVVTQTAIDVAGTQDGRSLVLSGGLGGAAIFGTPVDLSAQHASKMALSITYRLDADTQGQVLLSIGRDHTAMGYIDIARALNAPVGEWATLKITLDCFAAKGVDMTTIGMPFALSTTAPLKLSYSEIKLTADTTNAVCPN